MERRKTSQTKSSPLPHDYIKMIQEVFSANFESGLKILDKNQPSPYFEIQGQVFSNEVVVSVSLMSDQQISATTVHSSSDFDPKASSPTIQDLLSACVDSIGA